MSFYTKKNKIKKLLKKEHFIYRTYSRDISDHILGFFNIEYRIEGDIFLLERFHPVNAYEVYFKEHVPISCFEHFIKRSEELCRYGIKLLIITEKVPSFTREAINLACFVSAEDLICGIKKRFMITKLISN